MQVDLVVVRLRHIARNESIVLQWVRSHEACLHSLLDLIVEFLDRADADLLTILIAPDRQRCAPETGTREVPVVQVLQPVAETACTSALGLPVDGLVQFDHTILLGSRADEPRVEWIIKHGLICTPAVRIVVHVLLDLECRTLLLHLHTDDDIQVFCLRSSLLVVLTILIELRGVGILHVVACVLAVAFLVDTGSDEVVVEFLHHVILTLEVNHRTRLTFFINKEQTRDMGILSHLGIVGTEGRSNMHDTGTILCCYIIARNHAEGLALHLDELILAVLAGKDFLRMGCGISLYIVGSVLVEFGRGLYPRHQLLVFHTNQLLASIVANDTVRYKLLTFIIFRHLIAIGDVALWSQIGIQTALCQNDGNLLTIVGIIGFYGYIVDFRTYTECSV